MALDHDSLIRSSSTTPPHRVVRPAEYSEPRTEAKTDDRPMPLNQTDSLNYENLKGRGRSMVAKQMPAVVEREALVIQLSVYGALDDT